jgi:tetratricopeptide (TPR) repeat protein
MNNLAELYRAQGRYADAEPFYKRSLAIWEKVLGLDHPSLGASLNNLAEQYRAQGRYVDAARAAAGPDAAGRRAHGARRERFEAKAFLSAFTKGLADLGWKTAAPSGLTYLRNFIAGQAASNHWHGYRIVTVPSRERRAGAKLRACRILAATVFLKLAGQFRTHADLKGTQ